MFHTFTLGVYTISCFQYIYNECTLAEIFLSGMVEILCVKYGWFIKMFSIDSITYTVCIYLPIDRPHIYGRVVKIEFILIMRFM